MALTQINQPTGIQSLSLEIKMMIVDEVLEDAGMSFANVQAAQFGLLHTSPDFNTVTRSLMAKKTLWLRYELCSCMIDVATEAKLIEISDTRRPTYAPHQGDRPNGPTLSFSACRCNSKTYQHVYLVPYQLRALIRVSHLLGTALKDPNISSLEIDFDGEDSVLESAHVQDAFELMAILIREPFTSLTNCSNTVPSMFIGVQSTRELTGTPFILSDFYATQYMLEFASHALKSGRYLEVIDLLCIAKMDLVDGPVLWDTCGKRRNTYRMMHAYLAKCAVVALTNILRYKPEEISSVRYGQFDIEAISKLARTSLRHYQYLDQYQRISAVLNSTRLVRYMAQLNSPDEKHVLINKHEIVQSLSDVRAVVAYAYGDPSRWTGSEAEIEDCCFKYDAEKPEKINIDCKQKPSLKVHGSWQTTLNPWDLPEPRRLYHDLIDELKRIA